MYYNSELKQLQEKVQRKKRLEMLLSDLHEQEKELSFKAFQLHESKIKEDEDVTRLEGRSLAAFFYYVIGKMDDKLDKERREAYEAAVKYDMAAQEWEQVKEDIRRYEEECKGLMGCETIYEEALATEIQLAKEQGGDTAREIIDLEKRIGEINAQKKEVSEAKMAGRSVLSVMKNITSSLNSAESYGTWDLVGGGIFADMGKYSHLDKAQYQIERLQLALRKFKTELIDVNFDAAIQIEIGGFLKYADYAFDTFLTDWAVMEKIQKAQAQVAGKQRYVESILEKLDNMIQSLDAEKESLKKMIEDKVIHLSDA